MHPSIVNLAPEVEGLAFLEARDLGLVGAATTVLKIERRLKAKVVCSFMVEIERQRSETKMNIYSVAKGMRLTNEVISGGRIWVYIYLQEVPIFQRQK